MRACTTSRPDTKRGNPDGYQGNMTSGLAWIIRACLFQVCLWRACLCEEPICMYNEFLTEMVESLPRDYLFRVNKIEETFESVEKALSRFYRENCKKDFKCKDYTEDKRNSAVCYLLECLDGEEPECVSNVSYSLAEVELVSLKGFKCLVTDAFNHKYNSLQEVREQDKECDDVFVDAVRCQKATTLDLPVWTTRLRVRNGDPNPDLRCPAMEQTSSFADTLPGSTTPEGGLQQRSPTGHLLSSHGADFFICRHPTRVDHTRGGTATAITNWTSAAQPWSGLNSHKPYLGRPPDGDHNDGPQPGQPTVICMLVCNMQVNRKIEPNMGGLS
ncbi:uncharacterized protein ACWYII_041380 isoform 4-T5 [Salvelinus alpinus]